jgi:hypothetical protein
MADATPKNRCSRRQKGSVAEPEPLGVSIINESDGGSLYEAQEFQGTDICSCYVQHGC